MRHAIIMPIQGHGFQFYSGNLLVQLNTTIICPIPQNGPKWRIQTNKHDLHNSHEFSMLSLNATKSFKISKFEAYSAQVRTAMNGPNQPKTVREC